MSALNPEPDSGLPTNRSLDSQWIVRPAEDFGVDEPLRKYEFLDTVEPPDAAYERDLGEVPIKLSRTEIVAIETAARLEYELIIGEARQIDFLTRTVLSSDQPLHVACLLGKASQEVVNAVAQSVLLLSEENNFIPTPLTFKNTALLGDQLRLFGDLTVVESLNTMLTAEAQKAGNGSLHGLALLEVFDFFMESRQADRAIPNLVEAVHYLGEEGAEEQIPILPRVQNLLEQADQGLIPEVELGRQDRDFYEKTLQRIIDETADSLHPEILETRISSIRNKLDEGGLSERGLDRLELELYSLASDLQGQPEVQDLFAETLVMLGDVMSELGNREGALGCYMNAISLFEKTTDYSNHRATTELRSAREKTVPLLRLFKDRRLHEQLRKLGGE